MIVPAAVSCASWYRRASQRRKAAAADVTAWSGVTGMRAVFDRMRENLEATHGALYSQRALLALVEAGRRHAVDGVVTIASDRLGAPSSPAGRCA